MACSQSDQTWVAVITALIGAFFLAMGWLANYWLAKRTELYKLALAHTDNQLAQFHGPLYYKLSSEEMVWNHFRFTHRPHEGPEQPGPYYRLGETETNAGLFRFRHYNQRFFIPQLQEIRDLIIAKGHLAELEQDPITERWCLPQCLIDLCACVGASEPMMMAWKFREDELQEAAARS
ncbi:hypothetical protein O6H91_08G070100 [Diphasiastrum complanatum]|uniref:Uncharacterized protein n=2 Tax=Diphasiastrum complanatum TaxID=34168 RepID=A0ACC2CYP4_DIPCM|nr:hypothetical protein O6H91_08G069700 [Diphasiastrum complanatum]KAJ7547122.1 hypothetical protein O6H91_08G070100 [Diphasiastrum complanatum]